MENQCFWLNKSRGNERPLGSVLRPIGARVPVALIAAVLSLALSPLAARADWRIGKVINATNQPVSFSYPLPQGTTADMRTALSARGDAILYIPAVGPLYFKDMGYAVSNCSRPYWVVKVTYGSQSWKYYYDGQGIVDVSIAATGVVTLTPGAGSSPSSQVRPGNGIASCTE